MFAAPFAAIVGTHFLWRLAYYGDLWPNTYYAKHVRGWPEAGSATSARPRSSSASTRSSRRRSSIARAHPTGDRRPLLVAAWILSHAAYVVWIGGDHFEYRVLDFYWPFLAIAAVEGLASLRKPVVGAVLYAAMLVCATFVQVAKEIATRGLVTRAETHRLAVSIGRESFPTLHAIPGLASLLDAYGELNAWLAKHGIAVPYAEHKAFWRDQLVDFADFEALHGTGAIPEDAVTFRDSIGVAGFYLADLVIIDNAGLTERHVAHMPVATPNDQRYMAHERAADWPYLESRPQHARARRGPERRGCARRRGLRAQVNHDVWLPFDALDARWAERAFKGSREVRTWRVAETIGCFADGTLAGWTVEGSAFAGSPRPDRMAHRRMHPYRRCDPEQVLDSRGADPKLPATGLARSPLFRVPSGADLEFRLGGASNETGVRLLDAGGKTIEEWHPDDPAGLTPQRVRLREHEGEELQLVVYDDSGEAGGFVVVGEVVLLVPYVMNRP